MANAVTRTDFFLLAQPGAPGGVECRLVWPHLAKKRTVGGPDGKTPLADPKDHYYDCTLLVPKTHADPYQCANLKPIVQRMMEVVAARKEWGGAWPPGFQNGITDCDTATKWAERDYGRGHWAISPWSAAMPPRVVDQGNNDMPRGIDGEFLGLKSGDYVLVSLNVFGWGEPPRPCGVSFGIEAVKKSRDGEPIGSSQRSVAEIFGAPTGVPVGAPMGAPPLPGGMSAPPMPGSPVVPPVAPPAYLGGPPQPQVGYAPQTGAPSPYPPRIGGR